MLPSRLLGALVANPSPSLASVTPLAAATAHCAQNRPRNRALATQRQDKREWKELFLCKRRGLHTRTSSGSDGGSRGGGGEGVDKEVVGKGEWLSPEEKKAVQGKIGLRRDIVREYSSLDTILYHLGVGVSMMGLEGKEERYKALSYLNEHDPNFRVMPLFGTVPAQLGIGDILKDELKIDFSKLLQGEHYFQLYRPLPKSAKIHSIIQLADIQDKGKDAVFVFDVATRDSQENFLMFNQFCYFVRGAGGIGLPRRSNRVVPILENLYEDSPPTFECIHTTSPDQQAALFRLTGDTNPYLIDPSLAEKFGYKHPPLHGICSLGIVAHKLQEQFKIPNERFKGIKVRFSGPLFPGDTIRIWAWRHQQNIIYFNTTSLDTGELVHSGGYLTLY